MPVSGLMLRPLSSAVLRLWQASQRLWRLVRSSVPPLALGVMWSTWVAGTYRLDARHDWHRCLSLAMMRCLSLTHAAP